MFAEPARQDMEEKDGREFGSVARRGREGGGGGDAVTDLHVLMLRGTRKVNNKEIVVYVPCTR